MSWTETKSIIKQLKTLTSSLFARKCTGVIIHPTQPIWYMTNVPYNELQNRPNSDTHYHQIRFTNTELYDLIYQLFPLFKAEIMYVDLSILNKILNVPDEHEFTISEINEVFYFTDPISIAKYPQIEATPLARIIPQFILTSTIDRFCNYLNFNNLEKLSQTNQLKLELSKRSGLEVQQIPNFPVRIPYLDGVSGISWYEYARKLTDPYEYNMIFWEKDKFLRFGTSFVNADLKVFSIMPLLTIYHVAPIKTE